MAERIAKLKLERAEAARLAATVAPTSEATESGTCLVGEPLPSIMARVYPPLRWVVHEAVPIGLTLLSGPAKVGKSFMALDMALSVAMGERWMGRRTRQGRVLYLALEDGGRRIQDRARLMLAGQAPPDSLVFVHQDTPEWMERYGGNIAESMDRFIDDCKAFDFVIVDTLSRAFPGADQDRQHEMQAVLAPLQASGRAVLIIDHTKKGGGAVHRDELRDVQWIEQAAGSRAKGATVDAALGMIKVKGLDEEDSPEDLFCLGASLRDADSWTEIVSRNRATMRFVHSELPPKIDGEDGRRARSQPAREWLANEVALSWKLWSEIVEKGKTDGFSEKQLRTARDGLDLAHRREGFGGKTIWGFPDREE